MFFLEKVTWFAGPRLLPWSVFALGRALFCSCLLGVRGKCRVVCIVRPSKICQIKQGAAGCRSSVQGEMESQTLIPQEWQKGGRSCSPFLLQLFELLGEDRGFACLGGHCVTTEISPVHAVVWSLIFASLLPCLQNQQV